MIKTLNVTAEVPANRELSITLPDDVPVGPAEITLTVRTPEESGGSALGDLLHSEFFGMWGDRNDIQDSARFARTLREKAWSREP